MFYILPIILLLQIVQCINTTGLGSTCFAGSRWDNVKRKCIPCSDGYFGIKCAAKCSYPYYGLKCSQTCHCTKEDCHHYSGCNRGLFDLPNAYVSATSSSLTTIGDSKSQDINATTIYKGNSLNHQTTVNDKKTETAWIRSVMFGIIGLAAVSFFLTMIYLYLHKLGKRSTVLRTTQQCHI